MSASAAEGGHKKAIKDAQLTRTRKAEVEI